MKASQVVGQSGPAKLDRHLGQSTALKPAQTALFFQDGKHRFHQPLPLPVAAPAFGGAQFVTHGEKVRVAGWASLVGGNIAFQLAA